MSYITLPIVCSLHISAKMFGYVLLQISLQPLTKCTHRINCFKIVFSLQPHSSWILNLYWKEPSRVSIFWKQAEEQSPCFSEEAIPRLVFSFQKITEKFGAGYIAGKQVLECKTFLSLVEGSWVLKKLHSNITRKLKRTNAVRRGLEAALAFLSREIPSLVMP